MSRFKRFIKWLLFGSSPASQSLEALDNIQYSEKKNEFITSRIDLIGSFFGNHLFGISNRTQSTAFKSETGQGTDIGDDAGDFAWRRANYLDADIDSYEIGGTLSGFEGCWPLCHNHDHLCGGFIHYVNPANGLPMLDDCIDILGNPYGTDSGDSGSTLWEDHSLDSFMEDGFGANGSFDISGSTDPWDT